MPEPVAKLHLDSRAWGPASCDTCDTDVEEVILMSDMTFRCPDCGTEVEGFEDFTKQFVSAEDLCGKGYLEWEPPQEELSGARMGAVEGWVVTQDGETIKAGFATDFEAAHWLHNRQSQSVDWAVKHGGYDIALVRDGKVVWSWKRDSRMK